MSAPFGIEILTSGNVAPKLLCYFGGGNVVAVEGYFVYWGFVGTGVGVVVNAFGILVLRAHIKSAPFHKHHVEFYSFVWLYCNKVANFDDFFVAFFVFAGKEKQRAGRSDYY